MKNILCLILFTLSAQLSFAQLGTGDGRPGDDRPEDRLVRMDKSPLQAFQSTTAGEHEAKFAIDDDYESNSLTYQDPICWWRTDFGANVALQGISLETTLTNFYIFTSEAPFQSFAIEELIQDPWVDYFHVTDGILPETIIPTTFPVRHVSVISVNPVKIKIREIDFWIGPDGSGPGVGFAEDCTDGIDNDGDGLVDCEDYPCGIGFMNVSYTEPTCPICDDGEICIQAGNADEVSLDGGETWLPIQIGVNCFDNLPEGTYNVIARKSSTGCTKTWSDPIILEAPRGENGDCVNGGFEEGSFEGWTGGLGANNNGTIDISNQDFDLNNRHTIIPSSGFQDPFAPAINGAWGALGTYITRLGNSTRGSEAERLTYCFTVDSDNADFHFNYAVVLEEPGHTGPPLFRYKIYNQSTPNVSIVENEISSEAPFLIVSPSNAHVEYQGWTCVEADLSNLIGETVCVEFITADCKDGGHFGYAYIDGLCTPISAPSVTLEANEIYCVGQTVEVTAAGAGYNQFEWQISKLDADGQEYETVTLSQAADFNTMISDLVGEYEANSNYTLSCDQQVRVKFISGNGCASSVSKLDFKIVCPEYDIDYCDNVIHCSGSFLEVPILGEVDCPGCTYQWSPPQYLDDETAQFPVIETANWGNALNRTYSVTVTSPEGCLYTDQVYVDDDNGYKVTLEVESTSCSYVVTATITFLEPIADNNITLVGTDQEDNDAPVNFTLTGSSPTVKVFTSEVIDRDADSRVRVDVDVIYDSYACVIGTNCSTTKVAPTVPESAYSTPWAITWPNIFAPQSQNNNQWRTFISGIDAANCTTNSISSVSFLKISIFDRWGNLVFQESESKQGLNGLDGSGIVWDGTFNGSFVEAGVYAILIEAESCWSGSHPCPAFCQGNNAPFEECPTENSVIFSADVTVVY